MKVSELIKLIENYPDREVFIVPCGVGEDGEKAFRAFTVNSVHPIVGSEGEAIAISNDIVDEVTEVE